MRATTGGLAGAAAGGIIGGPVGALVGLGLGGVGGWVLDESADQKVSRLGDAYVNRPLAEATGTSAGGAAASGSPERSGAVERSPERAMNAEQVHDMLHDTGYDRVYNVRRSDDVFRARGERGGRSYDIVVDADTGRVISSDPVGSRAMRESGSGTAQRDDRRMTQAGDMGAEQIRQKLRREGYNQVSNVQRQGDAWVAQAEWDRTQYTVRVDARTGRIISSSEGGARSGATMGGSGTGGTTGQPGGASPANPQMSPPPMTPPSPPSGAPGSGGTTGPSTTQGGSGQGG